MVWRALALALLAVSAFVKPERVRALERARRSVGLVVVGGRYRGGKSLLLNALLGSLGAFRVGSSVNSCTRGIWIYPRPLRTTSPSGEEIDVFLADTEGLGATDSTARHDSVIFMLSMLLSSSFVFNSAGVIDEHALGQLSVVTQLARTIRIAPADTRSLLPDADEPVAPSALREFLPLFMRSLEPMDRLICAPLSKAFPCCKAKTAPSAQNDGVSV